MEEKKRRIIKRTVIPVILFAAVVLAAILLVWICVVRKKESAIRARFDADGKVVTYNVSDFVMLNNNVTKEMLEPEYWTDLRNGNGIDTTETIMTVGRINQYNESNRRLIVSSSMGAQMALAEINTVFNGNTAKKLITEVYKDSEPYADRLNLENIPWGIDTGFGFAIENTCLKKYPGAEAVYEDGSLYFDENVQSNLDALMPVAVIHHSADDEWLFVLTYGYTGWVEKKAIALCHSREEWLEMMNPENYLVVTGKELRIPDDPYYEGARNTILRMGTKLALVKTEDYLEDTPVYTEGESGESNKRIPYESYIVRVPVRLSDGYAEYRDIFIPVSSDVSIGYLPYTEENIVKLAMKYPGDLYGWGGSYLADDCSGLIRRIYSCFGFVFPRGSASQMAVKNVEYEDVSHKSPKAKAELLQGAPIGTLLYFPEHIMLYLGTVDGVPYCVSAVGSIAMAGMKTGDTINADTVAITDMLNTTRASGTSWLESVEKIVIVR